MATPKVKPNTGHGARQASRWNRRAVAKWAAGIKRRQQDREEVDAQALLVGEPDSYPLERGRGYANPSDFEGDGTE